MLQHCVRNGVEDIARAELALHFDGQAFAGVIIDQSQHAERGAIMRAIQADLNLFADLSFDARTTSQDVGYVRFPSQSLSDGN